MTRLHIIRAPDLGSRSLAVDAIADVPPLEAARIVAAGQAVEAAAATVNWPGADYVYVGAFSGLPSAATVPTGALALVTDVGVPGYTQVRNNGTHWRPTAPVCLLDFLSASGTNVAAAAAETVLGTERLLPGGFVQPGDWFRFMAVAVNATMDTNVRYLAVRQGTAASFSVGSGNRLARFASANASNNAHSVDKSGLVLSATSILWGAGGNTTGNSTTSAHQTETVATMASDSYLKFSALPTAGADWTVYGMSLILHPGVA